MYNLVAKWVKIQGGSLEKKNTKIRKPGNSVQQQSELKKRKFKH